MLIDNFGIPILINRVENHSQVKSDILNLLDGMTDSNEIKGYSTGDMIAKTDWQSSKDEPKEYWNIIEPIVFRTVCESMFEHFKYKEVEIANYWFQQYRNLDTHGWHVHPHCHWTNIYFIELPDESVKTQVSDYKRERLIDFPIYEGDILTFPSMLFHRSPPNLSDGRKTIVSFNINAIH